MTAPLEGLRDDLGLALRQAWHTPSVTLLVVVTLAVGIGANATMAGVIQQLVLQPPPQIREPHRVVRLLFGNATTGSGSIGPALSYSSALDFQRVPAFESLAAYSSITLSFGAGADAVELQATIVSPSYFDVFGVGPVAGRFFGSGDDYPVGEAVGGDPLAVLSHGFWKRKFAGNPAVVGRIIRVGQLAYTIVGVAPQGFRGVEPEAPDLWLPISVAGPVEMPAMWSAGHHATWVRAVARLRPGVSHEAAADQATAAWRYGSANATTFEGPSRVMAASIIRGRAPDAPREVQVALWLGGVAALVLVTACANVSSLLLARAFSRRREMAVRLALGAGRGRLASQMLLEASVLVAFASLAAIFVAGIAGRVLLHLIDVNAASSGPMAFASSTLLVSTGAVGLLTVLLISLAPVLQFSKPNLSDALRTGSAGGGGQTSRFRAVLLSLQAGLCMILLVGAGLFAMSLYRINSLDVGFDRDRTLMVKFDLDFLTPPEAELVYTEMVSRVRAIRGVERVAFAEVDPYRSGRAVAAHTLEHDADHYWPPGVAEIPLEAAVDSGFFGTVGATVRGRDFASYDRDGAQRVAIINEPLARILWPETDALGQCLKLPILADATRTGCRRVVGVVSGFWWRTILNRDLLLVYVPLAQRRVVHSSPRTMFVRAESDPAAIIGPIRAAVQGLRPDLPAINVSLLRDAIDPEIRPWRAAAIVFAAFGGAALIIAAVGLYGVVSFTATQRSPEIAVRVALGARPVNVLAVIAGQGVGAVAIGLMIGAVVALLSRRFVGAVLFQTSPVDSAIFGAVAALLFFTSAIAVIVPTARALRKNPAGVLRID